MAVGRFQVMATLQAARAYVLGHPLESAKSFGLNRAIFYAAAKRGFKAKPPLKPTLPKEFLIEKKPVPAERLEKFRETFQVFHLGDEMAYAVEVDGQRFFVIGNEVQTPEEFDKQIVQRFAGHFDEAWEEAIRLCQSVDRGVLLSQRYFYESVYKPRRDELARKWSELAAGLRPSAPSES
ncbi:MAG: hypothetical protein ONB23_09505 [candidate division KSB1 bacterium]|nr:hypothetical protein [candidate division KSB1 bacterium]